MREVQVAVELGRDPDLAGFNASMIRRSLFDEVRLSSVAKVELDIGKKCRLVSFDREMIVGFTFQDQVVSQRSLGEKGICCDDLAFDLNGIEEGDGRLDFIGSLELFIPFFGQSAYFFWV